MTIDPVELERLLTRYEELVGRHYRGTLEVRGRAEKYEADLRLATDLRDKLRTGQLVPAQASGDVVDIDAIVKQALSVATIGTPGEIAVQIAHNAARAAITTYEAVSGVAKMRDALRDLIEAIDAPRYGDHSIWDDLHGLGHGPGPLERARAALGEKP